MDTLQELTECLALQQEIDAKTMELRKRYKAVIKAERASGNDFHTIYVEIAGEMYRLAREDLEDRNYRDAIETARKLKGFWLYRLLKMDRPIRK